MSRNGRSVSYNGGGGGGGGDCGGGGEREFMWPLRLSPVGYQ